jgi:hypothetical protein
VPFSYSLSVWKHAVVLWKIFNLPEQGSYRRRTGVNLGGGSESGARDWCSGRLTSQKTHQKTPWKEKRYRLIPCPLFIFKCRYLRPDSIHCRAGLAVLPYPFWKASPRRRPVKPRAPASLLSTLHVLSSSIPSTNPGESKEMNDFSESIPSATYLGWSNVNYS